MFNVALQALQATQQLTPFVDIKIINKFVETVEGYPLTTIKELIVSAQVQPVSNQFEHIAGGLPNSLKLYEFWVLDNPLNVLSFVNRDGAYIEFEGKKFKVYEKADWIINGWISFKGSQL